MTDRFFKITKRLTAFTLLLSMAVSLTCFASADAEDMNSESNLKGKLVISELMVKNHATLSDEEGEQPDWIELHNISDDAIDIGGFSLSDKESGEWLMPDARIYPGDYFLVYADGKSRVGDIPHSNFSLSKGESVYLRDSSGALVDTAKCSKDTADMSLALTEDGKWLQTAFPSPGYPNTGEGYDAWQSTLTCTSPLIISEAMSYNKTLIKQNNLDYCDWIELKNVSNESIQLSDYCLSDDYDDIGRFPLPEQTLKPGASVIVLCTDAEGKQDKGYIKLNFSLDSQRERVYLSRDGAMADYVFLHDIPNACSFGRTAGENGWFYFSAPTPGGDNGYGYRRVSESPTTNCQDGVFNGVSAMSVELIGRGDIYYTTDGSLPTVESTKYEGPFDVTETCSVRAVAVESGAMPSRPLNLSYILNENHVLPVASLSTDDPRAFTLMYNGKKKGIELAGSLSFYEDGGSFTMPCGVDMHGETSLDMRKKNMGIHFRGTYGAEKLNYDLYGGGVTEFRSFILRAGQDYYGSIIKNELGENLCLNYSDNVLAQRSRYCVLYINGEYWGIYALMEKMNESHYATHAGVNRNSVTVVKQPVTQDNIFYKEIVNFALKNNLTKEDNYREFCSRMDIDSLIDWIIIEGYTGNTDLNPGNVRYCKSTEDDGKWRLMLYDLDSIFYSNTNCFTVVLGRASAQYSSFINQLVKVPEFRERFLRRAAEVFSGALSDENVLAEIDRLAAEIEPEVARDYGRFGLDVNKWRAGVQMLRDQITQWHWRRSCIDGICKTFGSDSADYFN